MVLVVEDEDAVRKVTADTLEAFGCRIRTARHGVEARELIEKGTT